jgi:hypothetical protein
MIKIGKYAWQLFGLYSIGYLAGMAVVFLLDNLLNFGIHYLPIIFALCVALPYYITKNFTKNEGRIFHVSIRIFVNHMDKQIKVRTT